MIKPLTYLAVAATAALTFAPVASAQENLIREFRLDIKDRVLDRNLKNNRAASLISRLLKRYVRRDEDSSVAFARIANRFLKKTVKANLRGKTALAILRGTARGFLGAQGRLDRTFERFVRLVVRKLPNSQKTPEVLRPIAERLNQINLSRGGTQAQAQLIFDLVFTSGGEQPPTVS